ncbi:YicC/YloC family endoribonuclease [Lutibacter sp. TH_r2]|uniref:YicC/YloC family endoribonuclease n=1 Tax=Lutibacter sp. TH_r2 TaxID=3082083 RepID=UPI002953F8F3|nr:YicC/YloC family endoribonuclease [Lutibacter sp. TH_r2]MDV7186792.1 YicC/YloC family endoribonuclease [Lutibacter sp. TH_r2]
MIQSMTGYGKTVLQLSQKKITIELKSLNSKNLDLNVRIPGYYREKELGIRKALAKELMRGKVDFSIYVEDNGGEVSSKVNEKVVKEYMNQLKNISEADELDLLKMAIRLPDSLKTEREELNEEEWNEIEKGISGAVKNIQKYRNDEGEALFADFVMRIKNIEALLEKVIEMDPERVNQVKDKLKKSIDDLQINVDENRFEQELIYYIEKLDITEEKVRLKNHLSYFEKELHSNHSNGKKLGFITQELGREINTIGSKSNYAPMQKLVVQMKDELEKIKEQNLNVL